MSGAHFSQKLPLAADQGKRDAPGGLVWQSGRVGGGSRSGVFMSAIDERDGLLHPGGWEAEARAQKEAGTAVSRSLFITVRVAAILTALALAAGNVLAIVENTTAIISTILRVCVIPSRPVPSPLALPRAPRN